jgi:hypothetical protein
MSCVRCASHVVTPVVLFKVRFYQVFVGGTCFVGNVVVVICMVQALQDGYQQLLSPTTW